MKRLVLILISLLILLALVSGCQSEVPIQDPYPQLQFGVNHHYDLVPSTGNHDRWLAFVPPSEAISTTASRRFFDEELQNAIEERSLLNDHDILVFAWDLQTILQTYDYIPEDYSPVSGTAYGNGIVRIIYANSSYVEMIETIEKYGEPVTGKEEYTKCYQYHKEKPETKDGQMYVFVSASDGHIIFMGGPHTFKNYEYR